MRSRTLLALGGESSEYGDGGSIAKSPARGAGDPSDSHHLSATALAAIAVTADLTPVLSSDRRPDVVVIGSWIFHPAYPRDVPRERRSAEELKKDCDTTLYVNLSCSWIVN